MFLYVFVLVRASSIHHVDIALRWEFLGLRWNWILELGGIAVVLVGALLALRTAPASPRGTQSRGPDDSSGPRRYSFERGVLVARPDGPRHARRAAAGKQRAGNKTPIFSFAREMVSGEHARVVDRLPEIVELQSASSAQSWKRSPVRLNANDGALAAGLVKRLEDSLTLDTRPSFTDDALARHEAVQPLSYHGGAVLSKHRSSRFHSALVLAVVLTLAAASAQAAPLYTITDLGTYYAAGLNNKGDVVGNADGPNARPFLYHTLGTNAGSLVDLSSTLGYQAAVRGINDSGQIVGVVLTPGGYQPFVATGSQVTMIQPPAGEQLINYGLTINNSGDVVGLSGFHPYLFSQGRLTMLVSPAQSAVGISNDGRIVGQSQTGGYIYQDGHFTDLARTSSTIPYPSAINSAGQVIGSWGTIVNGNETGSGSFLYQNGTFTNLGTLGGPGVEAASINSLGQIVGNSGSIPNPNEPHFHAFLYQNGTMFDLNNLVPAGSNWTLELAQKINDQGQIIGIGLAPGGGAEHSFLLTPSGLPAPAPIPEPSTLAFFGLTAVALAYHKLRELLPR